MFRLSRLAPPLVLLALAAAAQAQSRFAEANIGATNNGLGTYPLDYTRDNAGGFVDASANPTFSGLDAAGEAAEMSFEGYATAEANYGRLRAYATGTLTNVYYNEANSPFYDGSNVDYSGSPDLVGAFAFTGFTDTLTYGGAARSGYSVRYTFFVDGVATGTNVSTFILFKIGGNTEYLPVNLSGGQVAQYLTTDSYPIAAGLDQTIDVLFSTQFVASTKNEPSFVRGTGDFDSTATLFGISLYDPRGALVSGLTVDSASGTAYPVAPVPEPASFAALGLGLLALRRRKR